MWSCWKMAKGRRANKQVKAFLAKQVEASGFLCRLSPSHFPAVFSSALHVSLPPHRSAWRRWRVLNDFQSSFPSLDAEFRERKIPSPSVPIPRGRCSYAIERVRAGVQEEAAMNAIVPFVILVSGVGNIIRIRNGSDWGLLCGQEGSLALLRLHPIPDRRAFQQLLLPLCWFLCQLPWRAFFLFSNRLLESSLRRLAYEATAPVRNSLRTKDRSRATKNLVASRIALSSPGIDVWWESR